MPIFLLTLSTATPPPHNERRRHLIARANQRPTQTNGQIQFAFYHAKEETERETHRQMNGQTDKVADRQAERIYRLSQRQTVRPRDTQTER